MSTSFRVEQRPRRSLDGRWDLQLFEHPDEVAAGSPIWASTVEVPGNWTMQGTGDLPHYTNVQMPWPLLPPQLPDRVTTGVYRRSFTVPRAWSGQRVVLHVGGAESVHTVELNGTFVGYGTDSRLPSEYDLTPHLRRGPERAGHHGGPLLGPLVRRRPGPVVDGRAAPRGVPRGAAPTCTSPT